MSNIESDASISDDFSDEIDYSDTEADQDRQDIETFTYECLTLAQAEVMLCTEVQELQNRLGIPDSGQARMLLQRFSWDVQDVVQHFQHSRALTLEQAGIRSAAIVVNDKDNAADGHECQTCLENIHSSEWRSLDCGHRSCVNCWTNYLHVMIGEGRSTDIACMMQGCTFLLTQEFVLQLIAPKNSLKALYLRYCLNDWINSHLKLRFCPAENCSAVIKADERQAKKVICKFCNIQFCWVCGKDYHAPSDCRTMKKWLAQCDVDSKTARYIRSNTKECPKCGVSINKDGGCNYMSCDRCRGSFCWVCLEILPSHAQHQCSIYAKEASVSNQSALTKYLFYFERWDAHSQSLRLEELTRQKIKARMCQRVLDNNGTWIDWQYLFDAADILAKCRYTLQYTYPYAYYLKEGMRKNLFEYQQAELEAAIETLSYKLERAESMERADICNQMSIVEKRRTAFLRHFFVF